MPEIWCCCKARGGRISFMDLRPTSNAAAAAKIGNPEGCFLAGTWRRCSSVTERFGYAPSSRLASCPPENNAPIPHFDTGSMSYFGSGTATMPHGLPGDFTRVTSFSVARSTTETSSDGPLALKRYLPSGENVIPHGRLPTGMVFSNS